tara:strand:- start:50 stop:283 length:234 start_codon:yes stop_codon:yes gene_type:complete
MKTKNTEEYRNNITLHLTRISGDVEHIKQDIKYIVEHLEKINGRLRTAENSITAHKAVGITMVTVLTLAISLVGIIR